MAEAQSWQFEIVPYLDASVRCVLEIPGERTLHDLHEQILAAFSLPLLEEYAFFMNGDMDSEEFQYGPSSTSAPRDSETTELEDLNLVTNKRFMYAFDEDEDCAFDIRVLGRGGPAPDAGRIVTTAGDLADVFSGFIFEEVDHDEHPPHPAMEDHDEHGHHECGVPHAEVSAELGALAPRVKEQFEKWREREEKRAMVEEDEDGDPPDLPAEDVANVETDRDLIEALLTLSGGDPLKIHAGVEHTVGETVWPWIMSLPGRLSDAGRHGLAVAMCRRIDDAAPIRVKLLKLPVFLARAGKKAEALAQIEDNFRNAPEDMFALRYAGEALSILGEATRAEAVLRDALYWAGGNLDLRGEILEHLLPILVNAGRRADAEKIVKEETRRFEEMVGAMADED